MHIAVEGPIGAGKTTLARQLATYLEWARRIPVRLSLENYQRNAFLADFYATPDRWALAAQLDFLVSRHKQLEALPTTGDEVIVADHTLLKDRIFADLVLQGRELALYREIADAMPVGGSRPTLMIYLDIETDTLLSRIAKRGRDFETSITAAYLHDLHQLYRRYLARSEVPVLTVDADLVDPGSDEQLAALWQRILRAHPGSDRQ
ncbi:deoxynucleoside kinase [Salinicola corii]|uniref:Deoxynucleoside kinase n=1 Tax=Salinicola corii TaxID=2606937 RepID=A0A640WDZ9_9GAMM|nr:deoxynucleoside kinase [Salinicola corii]KAA0018212.1 deoxynucleoside kinase [Salinicola corii]